MINVVSVLFEECDCQLSFMTACLFLKAKMDVLKAEIMRKRKLLEECKLIVITYGFCQLFVVIIITIFNICVSVI